MRATLALLVLLPASTIFAQGGRKKPAPKPAAATPGAPSPRADSGGLGGIVGGLKLRSIGPALTEGRIFDGEGSWSIGAITIDPNDHNVIWVGTGENNAQRVVAFGDGVYKSVDGGK